MKKSDGKYVLIFFVLAAWVGLVILIVRSESSEGLSVQTESQNYSTRPYTVDELKAMAELTENLKKPQFDIEDDFSVDEPESFFDKEGSAATLELIVPTSESNTINEFNPYQDVIDRIIEAEKNEAKTNSELQPPQVQPEQTPSIESVIVPNPPRPITAVEIVNTNKDSLVDFSFQTGQGFLDIYNNFEQNQNVDFLSKFIYNDPEIDAYIQQKARERGYVRRGFAKNDDIISFENIQTRPEVKKAYTSMRDAMAKENIRLHFVSGYRSSSSQRRIFTDKMNIINPSEILTGQHDATLDSVLSRSAIPAYSKHHSGYAADFGCGNDYLVFAFAETECYEWISADNFKNARKYGFIPSYPNDVDSQGPNPEPWEYVWVGKQNAV